MAWVNIDQVTQGHIVVNHVMQPSPHTCGHACLAMVTGLDVQSIIARFGEAGINDDIEAIVLTESGIYPVAIPETAFMPALPFHGVYFATVPSLNIPGGAHRLVIEANPDEAEFEVHDPNAGREGKLFYPLNALTPDRDTRTLKHYGGITYLRPMIGHVGSLDRVARYRAGRG